MITHPGDPQRIATALRADPRSPSALAVLTGFSLEEVRAYRNGWRVPSAGRLFILAKALGVSAAELL